MARTARSRAWSSRGETASSTCKTGAATTPSSTSPRKTVNRGTWVKAQDLVLGNIFDKAYSIEFKTGIAVAFSPTPAASRFQNFDIGPHHPEELHRHRKEWPQRTQGRRRRQTRPGRRASRLRRGLHALETPEDLEERPREAPVRLPRILALLVLQA